jgi:hypothetical protein
MREDIPFFMNTHFVKTHFNRNYRHFNSGT